MDLYADWNGDYVLTTAGSLQAAVGWDQTRQRIIRRMITNPQRTLPNGVSTTADYVWNLNYGFGLGTLIDGDFTSDFYQDLKRRISQAVFADADIDAAIPPDIKFQSGSINDLWIIIGVTLKSGQPGRISLQVV